MWSRWWNYKWQLAIWMRYSNNRLCVIRFLIILEQSLICAHAYPVTTVVYTGVCMIPVHILHLSLTEICDIHIHYKCLSSVLRVSVPCWFMFDPLQLPQVSHCDIWDGFRFCWVGFISLKKCFPHFGHFLSWLHHWTIPRYVQVQFVRWLFWASSNVICFFLKIYPVDVFMTYDRGAVLDTTLQVSICLCHSSLLNLLLLVLPGVLSVGHSSTFVFPSCGAVLFLLF